MQGFIKNSGQRSLTYDATNISKVAGGDTVEELEVSLGSTHASPRRGGKWRKSWAVGFTSIWGVGGGAPGGFGPPALGLGSLVEAVGSLALHQSQSCLITSMSLPP